MTRTEYKHHIKHELEELNKRIDLKIVRGLPYKDDARRHKMLNEQLRKLKNNKPSWIKKVLATFIF